MSDDTREYFDEVASRWDEMRRQFFGDGVRRAAIAAAGVRPGMVVADVGIGTGFLAEGALDAGARVIGIDISDAMLAQARAKFAGRPFESRLGDVNHLPLGDGEADAVVANMVLHHAPDPGAAIREMARALNAGGTLVVTDAMVKLAQNDEQLLAVLAHEVGHVRHRHGLRLALQSLGVGALIAALAGDAASVSALAVAVPSVLLQSGYSRAFEEEADSYAFTRLKQIGVAPRHFADIMRRLEASHRRVAGNEQHVLDYLSSHPNTESRIARALSQK
jgi:ubiquinone/menaquinone biosynthesis C-methylase UbiE